MHNIEYKVELLDVELARTICRGIKAVWIAELHQTDTYYRIPSGRIKKRDCPGEPTEYIFYERGDILRPKLSHYSIYTEREAQTRFGLEPLPTWLIVKKIRSLFLLGNVRIHLDDVERLGDFMELEAIVSPSCNVARCHQAIARIIQTLKPALGEPIDCSYSDMMEREMQAVPMP
jgi:adenylate cyclase class IV